MYIKRRKVPLPRLLDWHVRRPSYFPPTAVALHVINTISPSLGKSIRVRLRGEGVRPVLTMLPADGRLDMGHVLEGDTVERCVLWLFARFLRLSETLS